MAGYHAHTQQQAFTGGVAAWRLAALASHTTAASLRTAPPLFAPVAAGPAAGLAAAGVAGRGLHGRQASPLFVKLLISATENINDPEWSLDSSEVRDGGAPPPAGLAGSGQC